MLLHPLAPSPEESDVRHRARGLFSEEQGAKAGSWVADDIMERCFRKARLEGSKK